MNQYINSLPLPIAIIGLGVSGRAAHKLLLATGIRPSQLILFDEKSNAAQCQNEQELLQILKPATLVVSPGVDLKKKWIQQFVASGGCLSSELSLAYSFLTDEKIIAITGSLGKSTVTSLLGAGLSEFTSQFFIGGNLGKPLADYALEVLSGKPRANWLALELSSYQLENFPELKADYSIITYLTPNHMERYASLEDYYFAKWSLTRKTKRAVIINENGGDLKIWAHKHTLSVASFWTSRNSELIHRYDLSEGLMLGLHNQDNLALVAQVAKLAGWPLAAFQGFKKFRGLPHRLENLGVSQGVTFVNDSKATAIDSVKTAISSLLPTTEGRVIALIGGRDKNLPWEDLQTLKDLTKLKFIFFGESGELAKHKAQLSGEYFNTLKAATHFAQNHAKPGDVILLSPGGTSLDEFKNFEERGELFKSYIDWK